MEHSMKFLFESMISMRVLRVKTIMITERWKTGSMPQPLNPSLIDDELKHFQNITNIDAIVGIEAPNEYDGSHGSELFEIIQSMFIPK